MCYLANDIGLTDFNFYTKSKCVKKCLKGVTANQYLEIAQKTDEEDISVSQTLRSMQALNFNFPNFIWRSFLYIQNVSSPTNCKISR
jgi:hypothetical protein